MNSGFVARSLKSCLLVLTIFSLAMSADAALAATKKKKSHKKPALAVTSIDKKNPKYAAIVVDAETGVILSQDSADALRHPASLTKMMTLLMMFDAMDAGKVRPGQLLKVSQRAASMPASKLGLRPGATIRVEDAIASLATLSANDMSVVIAETLAGSESAFAKQMTAKAQAIGMTRTRYYNASGLPNDYQVTTARDQAKLARYLLSRHPNQSRIFSKQRFYYNGRTYNNHNRLMETYAGMDCCKTGFINASGFNLVASAKRDGKRLIGVVFGGRTTASRNIQMASLLDKGFVQAKTVQVASAKPTTKTQVVAAPPPVRQTATVSAAPTAEMAAADAAIAEAGNPAQGEAQESDVNSYVVSQKENRESSALRVQTLNTRTAAPLAPQTLGTVNLNRAAPSMQAAAPRAAVSQPVQTASAQSGEWSIQIGAYQSRLATDQAIYNAQQKLPQNLRKNRSIVVPLRTADASWMFRARLTGFTQTEASAACKYFKDCITISPQSY